MNLDCGCPKDNLRFWHDWKNNAVLACVIHPPPEPEKPEDLIKMEQFGHQLMKQSWTGDHADEFLRNNPDHAKVAGSRAIAHIWQEKGTLIAYYVRSPTKNGWIYKL